MEQQLILDIDTTDFIKEEIQRGIRQVRNGEVIRVNGIAAKFLKTVIEITTEIISGLIKNGWNEGKRRKNGNRVSLVKISKKGDKTKYQNWRVITLPIIA